MKDLFRLVRAAGVLAAVSIMASCGGGGGGSPTPAPATSTVISGTAAAGAPVIGTVTVKDSSTPPVTKAVSVAANGTYSVDVAGMQAPFMMRLDGMIGTRSVSLFSAASSADIGGTINITPLTDLIVANIAGQVAEAVYDSGNFSGMTPAALTNAANVLRTRLQPVLSALGVGDSVDLLRATFNADHTGLDGALDAIRVSQDPAALTATIRNIIDNQQIVDDLASQSDASVLPQTNVAGGVTDLQQIVATFQHFSSFFAVSLPSPTNAGMRSDFTSDFLFDGDDLDTFLADLTSDPNVVGMTFTNVVLNSMTSTTADVSVDVLTAGRTSTWPMQMTKQSGTWKIAGTQRIADIDATAFSWLFMNGSPTFDTGLRFQIISAPTSVNYAIVTGSGLPDAGALYVRVTDQSSFKAAAGSQYMGIDAATPSLSTFSHNEYSLTDSVIAALPDNSVYVVKLMSDAGTTGTTAASMADDTIVATYSVTVPKRPFTRTELNSGLFAQITSPSAAAARSFAISGGNLTVNWTLPGGTTAEGAHLTRRGSGFVESADTDVASTATSAELTLGPASGTVVDGAINVFLKDAFRRDRITILSFP